MVELVLFSPPLVDGYGKIDIKQIGYNNPPMGLLYISSYLKKYNCSVKLVDLQLLNNPLKEVKNIIIKDKPAYVGFSWMSPSSEHIIKIIRVIKNIDKDILIIVGGATPTALVNEAIRLDEIDIAVYGEGEETMLDLLEKKNLNEIKGIAYKQNKKIMINPPRKPITNLDSLPFPDYDAIRLDKTYPHFGGVFFPRRIGIIASRGCPYKCTFCAENIVTNESRVRSPKNIVDEVEYLYTRYNIRRFEFYDHLFTVNRDRTIKICNEIIKRKLKIKWIINSRVDNVDKELLKILKMAGCYYIIFGIESGNQNILRRIKKDTSIPQIKNAIKMTKKVGLKACGVFIIGLPYENDETIKQTINLAKELPLDYAIFNIFRPFPGTKIFESVKKQKGIKILGNNPIKSKTIDYIKIELPAVSRKKLLEFRKQAYKKFYLRFGFLFKKFLFDPIFYFDNFGKFNSFLRLIR